MCGIIGYKGKSINALKVLINGLTSLEYRGYDSAGVSYLSNNKIKTIKQEGKLSNLRNKINFKESSNLGIGHTRWATHGKANKRNAHPHTVGNITIVHNGIIENYLTLKEDLIGSGYNFITETDSEVIAAELDYLLKTNDMITSLGMLKDILKGSYAVVIINHNEKDKLYAIKNKSPLILATKDEDYFLASDIPAIIAYTKNYMVLDDYDIVEISDDYKIYNNNKLVKREVLTYNGNIDDVLKDGYKHYMLKEIHEEPSVIEKLLEVYLNEDKTNFSNQMPNLKKYNKIHITACGSAYHTGLIAKNLFEEYARIETVCEVASEYRYKENFFDKKTLVIVISQSGETADTLASLEKAKKCGIDTIAIVNRENSSIARMADMSLYIQAGIEVAVATTKAYVGQVMLLSLLVLKYMYDNKIIDDEKLKEYLKPAKTIKDDISKVTNNYKKTKYVSKLSKSKNIFFIGRKMDYAVSMEGALKLKEISYLNAVCYQAGELKHGTISLIEKNTPVIAIVTEKDIKDKTISNIKEVMSRGAYVICVSSFNMPKDAYNDLIEIKKINPFFQPILTVIPLQLMAYYVALRLGCNIDKPRNLAKSVTVE